MKRFITFSVMAMALLFAVVGVVREQNTDATLDVSNGLYVLASQSEMGKSALVNNKMVFSADDFKKSLNTSEITSITVTELPPVSEGCLCVGDVVVNAGQTISASNLDLLNYRAADSANTQSSFKFKVNGGEYEITCKLYFLTRENSAPTLNREEEKIFSVSTHQTVTVYGKVSAYDPDGDEMRYEISSYAKNGIVDIDPCTGEYSYTPIGSYFGEDYFEYVAIDEYGNYSGSRRVNLTVEKLNAQAVYCDMDEHPAHHAALTMAEKGIMNGTAIGSNTYFMPDKSVSRLDFLVMTMHAIGVNETESVFDTGFDDDEQIPSSMKGYVRQAREMGIITGSVNADGEYLFEPNRAITRAEAALMVSKIVEAPVPTVKPMFSDRNEIPAWAHDAIYSLNSLGILSSENGSIAPTSDITRAQVAEMLYALMYHIE